MNEFIARRKLSKWLKPVEDQLSEGQKDIFIQEGVAYFESPQFKNLPAGKEGEDAQEAVLQELFEHAKNWVVGGIKQ